MSEKEREIVAKHEMGHALVALTVGHADPVHRVSIIPRGAAALGMTMQRPLEDRYLLTEPELEDRSRSCSAAARPRRSASTQISTGAQNDLERATEIARAMVTEYGMSDEIGPLSFGPDGMRGGGFFYPGAAPEFSEALSERIDAEVARLVNEAHDRATKVLSEHRAFLDEMAELLMVTEVIDGKDLLEYFEGTKPVPDIDALRRERGNGAPKDAEPQPGPDIVVTPPPPPGSLPGI